MATNNLDWWWTPDEWREAIAEDQEAEAPMAGGGGGGMQPDLPYGVPRFPSKDD